MGDSDLSASELRKRYNRGGTAKDDELTASQLRSRHGIPKNKTGKLSQHLSITVGLLEVFINNSILFSCYGLC